MNNKKESIINCNDPKCLIRNSENGGDCRKSSVVYEIKCKECNDKYVGETSRNGHTRGIEHNNDSKSKNQTTRNKSVILRHENEKHEGNEMQYDMKIVSTYQNNAFARQCGEAVRIKEIDPKKRINNKEEYHQPGDVEVIYAKNGQIDDEKKNKRLNINENNEPNVQRNNSENEVDKQRKITGYLISEIRRQCENNDDGHKNPHENEIDNEESNEDFSLSTQEFIEDARERRKQQKSVLSCEQCDLTSTSKTLLERHKKSNHEQKCEQCDFGAATKSMLERHMKSIHERKCEQCDYTATSNTSLEMHMKSHHEFKCHVCKLIFSSKSKLQEHINTNHNEDLES